MKKFHDPFSKDLTVNFMDFVLCNICYININYI